MPLALSFQLPVAAAIGVVLLTLLAEKLHARRCRVVAHLAAGPAGRPRAWVGWVGPVRAAALGTMTWAVLTLVYTTGGGYSNRDPGQERSQQRHVVFAADLSPSMHLRDAGPDHNQTRGQRMAEVADALLKRMEGDVLYTVIAFYTDALPVIVEAEDAELVRNVFNGLPIWYAMESGKTDLGTGVRKTFDHLSNLPKGSATIFLCTDGDTVALGSLPKPPPAAANIYVLGVGDPHQGTFIDGHMSRQDAAVLGSLAGRLRGQYLDVNAKHVPTLSLGALAAGVGRAKPTYELADVAILVLAVAAAVLATLPVLLEYLGSDWRVVRVARSAPTEAGP
jgi:Ca-activated chloride channel family protein